MRTDPREMPSRLRAAAKSGVRKAVRSLGYDIVPFATGLAAMQQRLLAASPVVIDGGANVGQFAERLRDLGYAGRIVSFEPGSQAFRTLQSKAGGDAHWDARRVALGRAPGVATLRISANSVSSSLLDVGEVHLRAAPRSVPAAQEQVPVSTLDVELSDVDGDGLYLKLDVQGYELPVLEGAEQTLGRTRVVQAEMSFDALYEGQSDWLSLCQFLQDRQFVVRYVEPGYEDKQSGYMLQADLLFVRGLL